MAFPLAGLALLAAVAGVVGTAHFAHRAGAPAERRDRARAVAPVRTTRTASPHSPEVRLLLYHLRYGSNLKRREVALALATLGPFARSAVPELVEFLSHDEDWWGRVRSEIETALVAIGPDALLAARTLAAHTDPRARDSGLRVLARLDPRAAVPALAAALRGNSQAAARQLRDLGEDGLDALLAAVADPEVNLLTLRRVFRELGKAAAPGLGALLADADQTTRERAARGLWWLGKNARPASAAIVSAIANRGFGDRVPLVRLLPHLDPVPPETIREAVAMVAELPLEENGDRIRALWRSGDEMHQLAREDLRLISGRSDLAPLRTLARMGARARPALPLLVEIMEAGDPIAAAAAADAHWLVSGDATVARTAMIALLGEPSGNLWHPALSVLKSMGEEVRPSMPALVRLLDSPNPRTRANAAHILEQFGESPKAERPLATAPPHLVGQKPREPDLALLRKRLSDPKKRSRALDRLGELGEKAAPAIPELIPLIDDETLRPDAADVLAAIGPAAYKAVPALEPYVEDPWWRGRVAVVNALWKITGEAKYRDMAFDPDKVKPGDLWAFPLLVERLPRKDAIDALGRLGPDARPAIPDLTRIAADESEDEYARDAARAALKKIEAR